jgi:hypothetical protein
MCDANSLTTCAECPDICVYGSCLTFDDICPVEFDLQLECQCHLECRQEGNCCSDEGQCPNGKKISFYFFYFILD